MIEGPGMGPEEAPIKVQVVYYLSRAGQLQQPHLIDVTISPKSNGLYLRDVKQRLTSIRGKGVADSFSWSCKRNYKDNFIWQDLSDDDKILPLGDGEFVLKGSGLYAGYRAAGKADYLDGQIDPESTSLSPKQEPVMKVYNPIIDQKKFNFEAVKRSLDQRNDQCLQDQSDLAAALSLSLQLMSNPHEHLKRFTKDKSMDLNQQVMNSLSQAKVGPAEECTVDRYDMSSNETFLSEESSTQNNFRDSSVTVRDCMKSTSSSSRTSDLHYDLPVAKQCQGKDRPISAAADDSRPKIGKDSATGRHEKPEELPPIKTKLKASVAQEVSNDSAASFMLSPRRIMAVLSTPEKKLGKMLHSSSLRSSTLSPSPSTHTVEPMSAMRFSKQATCLSQLRFCSQLSPHATDSRPDSPVRPPNTISILVQSSSATAQSPSSARAHSGPYWTRWKPGRKSRSSESSKASVAETPSSPTQAEIRLPEDRTGTTTVRRALSSSFEFDMPVDANSAGSGPATPQLPTGPTNSTVSNEHTDPASQLAKSIKISSGPICSPICPDTSVSADTPRGLKISSQDSHSNAAEVMAPISVKEVITELLPQVQHSVQQPTVKSSTVDQTFTSSGASVKEVIILLPKQSNTDGSQRFNIQDTAGLPRVSISDRDSIPVTAVQPESPESPLKQNPPCSPIRITTPKSRTVNSPAQVAAARPLVSPGGSYNRRTEDGRARARGLVKEVASKDSKFMKDLAKDMERSKPSGTVRSVVSSKRVSGIKNGSTTMGAKSVSSTINRSPPRISSLLWEEAPQTPKKNSNSVNRDERPLTAGRSTRDWEKTLQEAASVSLPPPDFGQILQECGQCGRTFKPDSLKVHMRGCNGVRRYSEGDIQTCYGTNLMTIRTRQ
ncbi:unnamed protein product [Calypogeia fissa]